MTKGLFSGQAQTKRGCGEGPVVGLSSTDFSSQLAVRACQPTLIKMLFG
jgi:hypothetical protein